MKPGFITKTIKAGIFFVLPLALVIFIFMKIIHVMKPVTHMVGIWLGHKANILLSDYLISVILLLLLFFLGGLMERHFKTGVKLVNWIEENLLAMLPAYQLIRNVNQDKLGVKSNESLKVVLAPVDGWVIAFEMEEIDEQHVAVFVPGSPDVYGGNLIIFERDRLKSTNLTSDEAYAILRRAGYGAGELLKDCFKEEKAVK